MKLLLAVTQYIELKQSMGSRFHSEAVILKAFSRAVGDIPLEDVGEEQAYSYIAGKGPVTRFWHRKHEALRGFYRFAMARGLVSRSPLPTIVPKADKIFSPYIFSREELQRLLAAALPENPRTLVQANALRTLVLLLYGAGLRISEALALQPTDVNLETGLLAIHESKFYKSRLVPIGPQLTSTLSAYAASRPKPAMPDSTRKAFFVTRFGTPITRQMAERAFAQLRLKAAVCRTDGSRYQPRLHDLRHAFAVHRVTAWYRQGLDVQALLPKLATYLGHINIAATQRYLTMTPELLGEASLRFEHYVLSGGDHG